MSLDKTVSQDHCHAKTTGGGRFGTSNVINDVYKI